MLNDFKMMKGITEPKLMEESCRKDPNFYSRLLESVEEKDLTFSSP